MHTSILNYFLVLFLLLPSSEISATELTVPSKTTHVTIYHSGALVTRTLQLDIPAGSSTLAFDNLSAKCVLNSIKLNVTELTILNRSMIKKLTPEQHQRLRDQKESLGHQLRLLEGKYDETGFVKDVAELERMMALYSQRILEIKRNMRSVDDQLAAADKLNDFNIRNEDAGILHLTVSSEKAIKRSIELSYLVGGIGWSPSYDLEVNNISSASLELKYMARVMSQTGEDWDNVSISLSSAFPLAEPNELPKSDAPWLLNGTRGGKKNNEPTAAGVDTYEWQASQDQKRINAGGIENLKGISYQTLRVPAFLENRELSGTYTLKSNSTVFTFPILNTTLPSKFYYYGYPMIDPEAYLVAEMSGWDSFGFMDGVANIRFDGNDAGRSMIYFSESTDTLLLPIGPDNSVFMKQREIADEKYFKEIWASRKSQTTLAYEYVVKNNNPFPITFRLIDQVPVSQSKTDKVTILSKSGGVFDERSGEVTWDFELQPSELLRHELIFTIEMEKDPRALTRSNGFYSGRSKQRFRGVSCPTF